MKQIKTELYFGYADSHIGGRIENQDTCAIRETCHGLLILVCDGMGGGPSGKLASMIAAQTISENVAGNTKTIERIDILSKAIRNAHTAILENVASNPQNKGMGTTVTALLINEESAIIAHVGDSRVYQFRRGVKKYRTLDHSMVFELISSDKKGKKRIEAEEQARLSPQSNVITRALGHGKNVFPEIVELPYEKGDRFMLCTDGIWGMQPEKDIVSIVANPKRAIAGVIESLTIKTENLGKEKGGGHDNFTVAIIETSNNSKLKEEMSTKHRYMMIALATICGISLIANLILLNNFQNGTIEPETRDTIKSPNVPTVKVYSQEEVDKISEQFSEQIDSLKKGLEASKKQIENLHEKVKSSTSEVESSISSTQTSIYKSLDMRLEKVISRLNNLATKSGKKSPKEINSIKTELGAIKQELIKANISTSEINTAIQELSKEISTRPENDKKSVKGHYTEIIKKLNETRRKLK